MPPPSLLYVTLLNLLGQAPWRGRRHLVTLAWMVMGLLSSGWIALSEWTPFVVSRAAFAQSTERRYPRLVSLIRRWLKAGILEDGALHPSEEGTPQGGSIGVLLSNLYLHYVLDLWFERIVKARLKGEA